MSAESRESALTCAIRYLGTQYQGLISPQDLRETLASGIAVYQTWRDGAVWYLIVPSRAPRTGSDRVIVIEKRTGNILHDSRS